MAITVSQIAEICGVSRTTALRALNNQGRVSAETKEKVLAVAKENGYRPNLLARSLNQGRTMSIGVISINMENMYFVQTLSVINREADKRGYLANIVVQGDSLEAERNMIQQLADRKMEGLIISPMNQGKPFEEFLKSLDIPVVCIGNTVSDAITTIKIDEKKAMYEAVMFVLSKQYQEIIFVCPPLEKKGTQNISVHEERLEGFQEAIADNKEQIKVHIVGDETYIEKVAQLLESAEEKCAVICSGDIYALNIMKWAKTEGKKIPDDFGLMGFDNISMLEYITPALTTVSTNVEGVAKAAVEVLVAQIEGNTADIKSDSLNFCILDRETI